MKSLWDRGFIVLFPLTNTNGFPSAYNKMFPNPIDEIYIFLVPPYSKSKSNIDLIKFYIDTKFRLFHILSLSYVMLSSRVFEYGLYLFFLPP